MKGAAMMPRSIRARRAWPVALLVLAVLLALLPAQRAFADHTPIPSTVTLVGSLQDELGCPGDWQPDCAATRLAATPADPEVFTGSFTVPSGSYEYKVALNGSWNENYGANGAAGGANITLKSSGGLITFTYDHRTHLITDDTPKPLIADSSAQWLRRGIIGLEIPAADADHTYRLYWSTDATLARDGNTITGGDSVPLTVRSGGLPKPLQAKFPQLAEYEALTVPASGRRQLATLLTAQLAVASFAADGSLTQVTGVQLPGVLDDVYASAQRRTLGPVWRGGRPSVRVWAPTAQNVDLLVQPVGSTSERRVAMRRDDDGVWHVRGTEAWRNARYRFAVRVYAPSTQKIETNLVTDPYSLGLTTDSARSILVNLDAASLKPAGWNRLQKPELPKPEYSTIYELHVRDFSISDRTVPAKHRGTYLAFTDNSSNGMRHLRELARSGLNTVHLLPVNDIASIEEDKSKQQTPDCDLASYPPAGEQQQACVTAVAANDGFNWGYDPLHYTAPEGSYSTNPNGTARNLEFRQMVQGLNRAGQRVVMDVVYNHTPAAGQDDKSILDRVVPGYYQRLNATGQVETSTCCSNTATEHTMMAKLMIDSVLTWAREHRIDSFRFDLMGHQPSAAMIEVQRTADAAAGRHVPLLGEGWNFGEIANGARFPQAAQGMLNGTGIASFSDRARDALRGGGCCDSGAELVANQGLLDGLAYAPNARARGKATRRELLHAADLARAGLAGTLRDYRMPLADGRVASLSALDYKGMEAGYASQPGEVVNYVENHDNPTLWDIDALKLPQATTSEERARVQLLGAAFVAFSQGIPYFHAGMDLLRSKSLDRNSFDSGDWFNRLDWTYSDNGFAAGLPPRPDNGKDWELLRPVLRNANAKPSPADIAWMRDAFRDLLRIRASTPLFRLRSADEVQRRLAFRNAGPAQNPLVIAGHLDGSGMAGAFAEVLYLLNVSPEPQTLVLPDDAGKAYVLHPLQAAGSAADARAKQARYRAADGHFSVPGRTAVVFVIERKE